MNRHHFLAVPWPAIAAGLMIAAHMGLVADGARRQWVTYDEVAHLPAGINYWQKGRFFIYHHNPPLTKMLAALPAMALRPVMQYSSDYRYIPGIRPEWRFGQRFMRLNRDRYLSFFIAARMTTVLWSGLGALFVLIWSRELFGPKPALVSLALWCFSPTILAHAQLVTPDVGATAAGLISVYTFRRFLLSPSWPATLVAGFLLGVAALTKFTLLALYPAFVLIAVVRWLGRAGVESRRGLSAWTLPALAALSLLAIQMGQGAALLPAYLLLAILWWLGNRPGQDHPLRFAAVDFWGRFLVLLGLSLLVVNAGYGFEGTFERLGDYSFQCRALTLPVADSPTAARGNRFTGDWAGALPVPLPRHFVTGLDAQKFDSDLGFMNYLEGRYRQGGWWYYYPFAAAVRTPPGTILLALLAAGLALANPRRRLGVLDEVCLALPALAVLGLIVSQSGIQYSRYLMPCYPFVFISLGRVAVPGRATIRGAQIALVVALLVWNAAEAARIHPHELSYFNELAGGPEEGHRHLLETSDWGQDLTFLKAWIDHHPEAGTIRLAYSGNTDPSLLGIKYVLPPIAEGNATDAPTEQDHDDQTPIYCAVGAQLLHGFDWTIVDGSGNLVELPWGAFSYFSKFEPIDRAGYSILIYKVSKGELDRLARTFEPFKQES